MTRAPCTWADAELVVPGIEAEWSSMVGQKGGCLPPAGKTWRVEVVDWGDVRFVAVIDTTEPERWAIPPEWRCWSLGNWTHPYPLPKALLRGLLGVS
jgi:hypothetical protein